MKDINALLQWINRKSLGRMQQTSFIDAARRYQQAEGEDKARQGEVLIRKHLFLIFKTLRYWLKENDAIAWDLFQEGCLGFLHGLDRWDETRHQSPYPSIHFHIRGKAIRLLQRDKVVKSNRSNWAREAISRVRKALEMGHTEPEAFVYAAKQGAQTPGEIEEVWNVWHRSYVNLDVRDSENGGSQDAWIWKYQQRANAVLGIPVHSTFDLVLLKQVLSRVAHEMEIFGQSLTGRDLVLWTLRLNADKPATLDDVGRAFEESVTRERVRQIEVRLKEKCRKHLMKRLALTEMDELLDFAEEQFHAV